jgi:integrase
MCAPFSIFSKSWLKKCRSLVIRNIIRVQKLLGHSSVKTTEECYADLRQDDLKKSVKQLSKLLDRALKESRKNN